MRHTDTRPNETFKWRAILVRRTAAAVCLQDLNTGDETWIPLSCILEMTEISSVRGERPWVDVRMTRWIAEQKGLT